MNNRKFTAYCGLYCLDCIPSNKNLFQLLGELEKLLQDIKFQGYADLKAKTNENFKDYSKFIKVLQEMKKLECVALCSEGGCKTDCKIRECVLENEYDGCWQCTDFKECRLLDHLKDIHPIIHNLGMIKKYGVDNWADKRGNHYSWL